MYDGCDCCEPSGSLGFDLEAIFCLANRRADAAHRHHNRSAKDREPRKVEKRDDPFLIMVEGTDPQDEEKDGAWKCHYKYHVYMANITAIGNWSRLNDDETKSIGKSCQT